MVESMEHVILVHFYYYYYYYYYYYKDEVRKLGGEELSLF